MISRSYAFAFTVLAASASLVLAEPLANSTASVVADNSTGAVAERQVRRISTATAKEAKCEMCSGLILGTLTAICASDGNTYYNFEALNCANLCGDGDPEIEFVHFGECKGSAGGGRLPAPPTEVAPMQPRCLCLKNIGTEKYEPFCGSDGFTYSCESEIECVSFCYGKNIKKVYDGPCKNPPLEKCNCLPSFLSDPVCGSDGNTYANPESLLCSNYCTKKRVKQLYEGNCIRAEPYNIIRLG